MRRAYDTNAIEGKAKPMQEAFKELRGKSLRHGMWIYDNKVSQISFDLGLIVDSWVEIVTR
jgi:hypothetical protein